MNALVKMLFCVTLCYVVKEQAICGTTSFGCGAVCLRGSLPPGVDSVVVQVAI